MKNETHSDAHEKMMNEPHHDHEMMQMETDGHDMDMMNHGGHMMHMGGMSKKLKVSIVLMIPLLLISPIAGFTILKFPGSEILQLILGTIIFFYSGTPFFSGAKG